MTVHVTSASKRAWTQLHLLAAVASLLALGLGWPVPAHAVCGGGPSFPCDWGYKRKLTFNNSGQVENLVDVPVLVVLNSSRIDYSNTQNAGQDLRFTDSDGTTLLAHEIEKWDEAGTSYVWVKVPQIDGASTTDHIWMFYGNPTAPDGQNPAAVWSNGYLAVWHLKEDPSGTAPQMKDSTSNANHGTSGGGMTSADQVPGKIAGSLDFDGSNDEVRFFNTIIGDRAAWTITAWMKMGADTADKRTIYSEGHTTAEVMLWLSVHDSGSHARFYYENPEYNWTGNIEGTTNVEDDQFHHVAMVQRSKTDRQLFVDTVSNGTNTQNPGTLTNNIASIGYLRTDSYVADPFKGILDEVRISSVARSSDWLKAQYLSMTDAFISFGSSEAVSCGGGGGGSFSQCDWQARRKLTFNNSAQAENLVDFPVLVVLNSSRIDYGQTQNAGQDLRFTDSDGVTLLAHEIEKWDEAGTSYVWVKVPQIDGASTTDHIYMYYGNASAPDGQNPGAVWSNGFGTVWHLHNAFTDSTCNAHDASLPSTWNWDATGKIAGGLNFQALDVNGDDVDTGVSSGQDFTLEFWYKGNTSPPSSKGYDDHFVVHAAPWNGLAIGNFGDPPTAKIDWTSYGSCCRGPFQQDFGNTTADWHTLTLDWNGAGAGTARLRLYKNGVFQQTGDLDQPDAYWGNIYLGNPNWNTYQAGNDIDEFRVSTTVRSDAWIAAQHKSMTDTFITFGSAEGSGGAPQVIFFTPDAFAPGVHVPVTFVGSFCSGSPTVTTSSSDVIGGPSIVTDSTGAVVTQNGTVLSTVFFVKPNARPTTGVTVSVNGAPVSQTFDIVIPGPDPNVTSGTGTLSGRTKRGTKVLGGLTVGASGTLKISTNDTDGATAGNQGYLPAVILVKGDVNIAGTVDVKGQNGANAGASTSGGDGGAGGPGGGGGGGGGVSTISGGGGAVAIDAISTNTAANNTNTITISHTTSGTDRLMLVFPQWNSGGSVVKTVTGVTYNGIALTRVGGANESDDAAVDIWKLVAPPTGTYNVVITYSANLGFAHIAGVVTFTGVDQTTPLGTFAGANGTSTSASVNVSSATGELVVGTVCTEQIATLTLGAGQTALWDISVGSGNATHCAASTEAGATTVTTSWTFSTSDHWAIGGVSIKPNTGGGGGGGTAAAGAAGLSGGGGGGSTGTGTGGAGGTGTNAAGSAASGTTGGDGGTGLGGPTGGGGGKANTEVAGGDGGGGGTGHPFGTGGSGASTDGAPGGEGGGGGGASGGTPGGGGGGGFATAGGTLNATEGDAGLGGSAHGNAQLVPLMGGSGGGGGGPDIDITSGNRGGGGGGGGGAVHIYATGSITMSGTITAQGGNGGNGYTSGGTGGAGGGGSGGVILLQSGTVTATGTLTTAAGTGGTSAGNAAGGAGGTGRIRIDGLSSGSTVPGTAGSKFIGPVIDTLVDRTVKGRSNGGSTVTLYVYDQNGAQVSGSPYTTSASGSSGTVGTWTISNVTFPSSGTGYLAVKQSSGSVAVFGPGRATKGIHLINWREVY